MPRLLILDSLLLIILSGCALSHNDCYKQCYATMNVRPGPIDEPVELHEAQDDLEQVITDSFRDCIIVGNSHFCGPPVRVDLLKRFAAKKGANVILWRATPEKAGFEHECQCNPIGAHGRGTNDANNENEIEFTSVSVSVHGSAAAGPGATTIYYHQIWFLYRGQQW